MKISFTPHGTPFETEDGEFEVKDTKQIHRYTLVDGVVVDKYKGKTDAAIVKLEYEEAVARATEAGEDIPPQPF